MKVMRILYWLLTIFVLYLIIEIIRKIFGGSLGFEELVTALLVANLGYSIGHTTALHMKIAKVQAQLSEHLGWHKGK